MTKVKKYKDEVSLIEDHIKKQNEKIKKEQAKLNRNIDDARKIFEANKKAKGA